ncbi:dihydrodipicolinate synthase family protein [Haladaptatus salinisoli]|uniref:dihydrodipicolinate synthase family protein n=1 Tax=Haladaptatus salinisoli TaxID=2884876 RepID=UPI001D09A4D4|nr:dihydrodipicolinate synthase family protein [Haladaptatus salinisoli]
MTYEPLKDDLRDVAFTNPTPFDEDGEMVLHDELASNIEYVRNAGARLIVPCGNTGEYYSLSNDERVAVVETTTEAFEGAGSVVGGVGGSTKNAKMLADRYADVGADAIMVMHPVHTYMHEDGILDYYRSLVDHTDLGVVLYKRGAELTHEHIRALSERENVVAVKYAVGDLSAFSKGVRTTPGDIVWINGIAERFAPSFHVEGAEGFTTGIGNFIPQKVLTLQEALDDGDLTRAKKIRDLLRPYEDLREETGSNNRFSSANNVPAVKYGLELAGQYGGSVREPLVALSEDDQKRAEEYYEVISDASL